MHVYFGSYMTWVHANYHDRSAQATWSCKANNTVCFASSQVWSELRMRTTSWDLCRSALPRERTSQPLPATSHTSSTRVWDTTTQSKEVIRSDPQIQLLTNHIRILLPRDPQTHRRTSPTTRLMKTTAGTSRKSTGTSVITTMAAITTPVKANWQSIVAAAINATAINMKMTTDMEKSRGSTSAGDGRNVCKGNFSFWSTCNMQH